DAGDERRLGGAHADFTDVEPIDRLVIGINRDAETESVEVAGVNGVGNGGLLNFQPIIIRKTQVLIRIPQIIPIVAVGIVSQKYAQLEIVSAISIIRYRILHINVSVSGNGS